MIGSIEKASNFIKSLACILTDVRLLAAVIIACGFGLISVTWDVAEAVEDVKVEVGASAVEASRIMVNQKFVEHQIEEDADKKAVTERLDRIERSQNEIIRALGRVEGMLREER